MLAMSDSGRHDSKERDDRGFRWQGKELSSGWDDEDEQTQLRARPVLPVGHPVDGVPPETRLPETRLPETPVPQVAPTNEQPAEDDGSRAVTVVFHQDAPHPHAREASIKNEPKVMFDPRLRVSATALPNARHLLSTSHPEAVPLLPSLPPLAARPPAGAPGGSRLPPNLPAGQSDWPVAMGTTRRSSVVAKVDLWAKAAAVAGAAAFVVTVSIGSIALHRRIAASGSDAASTEASASAGSGVRQAASAASPGQPQGFSVGRAPAGTTVIIDGTRREAVPATIRDLGPGIHYLRFEAGDRFNPVERTVEVRRGEIVKLDDVVLPLRMGTLTLHVEVADAEVTLRHAASGRAKRVEGPFPRTIEIPGHGWEVSVESPGGETRSLDVVFKEGRSSTELRFDQTAP
jgi:hypothetical protein